MRSKLNKNLPALITFVILYRLSLSSLNAASPFWEIQSIDTMKYSRDLAREKKAEPNFSSVIESQIEKIASTGATHVAIATPYDEEFVPFLSSWVSTARKFNLNVWFRGNFSGWEGWFNYPPISKEEHIRKTENFILENPDLFMNGDLFTSCTECENGNIGDPRSTGEINEFRYFLIQETNTAKKAFETIKKDVKVGLFPMNGDVARLIMDQKTTQALGGIAVIDHYVETPEKLLTDIDKIAQKSQGKIILGEIGVPIPDIHGFMTEGQQAQWMQKALTLLSNNKNFLGINYWVSDGGSTQLWNGSIKKQVVDVLRSFFSPTNIKVKVVDEIGNPIDSVKVEYNSKTVYSNAEEVEIQIVPSTRNIKFSKSGYKKEVIEVNDNTFTEKVVLQKEKESIFFKFKKYFYSLVLKYNRFRNH